MDKIIKTGSKIAINISEKDLNFKLLVQHPNINNPSNFYVRKFGGKFLPLRCKSSVEG